MIINSKYILFEVFLLFTIDITLRIKGCRHENVEYQNKKTKHFTIKEKVYIISPTFYEYVYIKNRSIFLVNDKY